MRTFIFLMALLLVGCQSTEPSRTGMASATIDSTEGETEFRRGGSDWQPARADESLASGDELRTGSTGQLNLNLGKQAGILTLHPNSHIRIDSLSAQSPNDPPVTLTLTQGRITGDTLRDSGSTKVLVHTGKASIKVP